MSDYVLGPLCEVYIGDQTAQGAAATTYARAIWGRDWRLSPQETWHRYEGVKGRPSLAPTSLPPELVDEEIQFTQPMDLDANGMLLPLRAAFGLIVPTGGANPETPSNGVLSRVWTFAPPSIQHPDPTLYTLLWIESDTEDPPIQYALKAEDIYCTQIQIQGNDQGVATFTATYMGNGPEYGATIPSPAPDLINPIIFASPKVTMSIDDTWAAMVGATPAMEINVMGLNATLETGLEAIPQQHGSFGFKELSPKMRPLTITATAFVQSGATSLTRAEQTHKRGSDKRFVKLRFESTKIIETVDVAGVSTPFPYYFEIGGCMYHDEGSIVERGGSDSAGRLTMSLNFKSADDESADHRDLYIALQNNQSAFP